MDISIFLAKVMGLYLIITGLFVILRCKDIDSIIKSLTHQKGVFFLLALITLIIGLLLVVSHNIWVADWRVIITILAWLTFAAGILRLFLQDALTRMSEYFLKHKAYPLSITILFTLIGCYLTYKGFS
jgi:hypothetical protein